MAAAMEVKTVEMADKGGVPDEGRKPSESNHVRIAGALAGMGSGLTKVTVGHGFDTVKTRMQCSPPGTYAGALDCLMKTVRREGPLALYKGVTPPAVGWAAIDSVLLGSLHNYRLFIMRTRSIGLTERVPQASTGEYRLSLLGHGVAGLLAGWTSSVIANPIELLKVKLQVQLQRAVSDRQFRGPIDCALQVYRAQGIRQGLWRGIGGSIAFRSSFFWMFLSFEGFMRLFTSFKGTRYEMSTGLANFLSGGLGSFTFWLTAMPADNVKNRIMAAPLTTPRQQLTPLVIARQIYVTSGWTGFYRGFVPCALRAFPVNASAFFVYEGLMRWGGAEKTRQ